MIELNITEARQLMLAALGLVQLPQKSATKDDLLATVRQMHLLQIDTISVVARSHHLVLWSRLGDYPLDWVDELLADGQLFEYWSHAACMLSIEDYPLYRHRMLTRDRSLKWIEEHQEDVDKLLAYIRDNGPVRSADFERPDNRKGAGWWDWKAEKVTLEVLFNAGILAVAKRQSFQRFYDLHERVMPEWSDDRLLTETEIELGFARKALQAIGVAQPAWVSNYFYRMKKDTLAALKIMEASGEIYPAKVEGWKQTAYIHRDNLPRLDQIRVGQIDFNLTTLLSPFDPLVSDRDRALATFGYDYRIECYTPAPKRRYGYFSLSILHRGQLVGRLDAKAHRKDKIFEVKQLHLEPGVVVTDTLVNDLAATLQRCADWHKTPEVVVRWSDPAHLTGIMAQALEKSTIAPA